MSHSYANRVPPKQVLTQVLSFFIFKILKSADPYIDVLMSNEIFFDKS